MSLVVGSVTVNQTDGTLSGSGLALAIAQAQVDAFDTWLATNHPELAFAAYKVFIHNSYAQQAGAIALAIVTYLTANAEVRIAANSIDSGVPPVDRTFGVI